MKNNKGFSLVELIVVISIMAVLVGIIAPQFLGYVERSKVAVDQANVDMLNSVTQVYYVNNQGLNPFNDETKSYDELMEELLKSKHLTTAVEAKSQDAMFSWDYDEEEWYLGGPESVSRIDTNNNGKITIAEAIAAGYSMPIYQGFWLYKYMKDGDNDGMVGDSYL